jgi:hypothetical protein
MVQVYGRAIQLCFQKVFFLEAQLQNDARVLPSRRSLAVTQTIALVTTIIKH